MNEISPLLLPPGPEPGARTVHHHHRLPLPLLGIVVGGILGAFALCGAVLHSARQDPRPAFVPLASMPAAVPHDERVHAQGVSITPITSLGAASSGLAYSGDSYEVACTISGTVVLYPVVHNGTAWEGPYDGYGCTLTDSITTKGTCIFPARSGTGLTWNAFKTGSGTVSSCTASGRAGPVPSSRAIPSSGPGSGTVTSIDCETGLICTPDPITSTGTIAPDFGTATGKVVQGGVVSGASCAYPTSVTYNDAGQVTACTPGSAPSGGGGLYIFGDGSDGDVSISGGTTALSRDMNYDTLTVTGTGVLKTNGYRVYAKTAIVVESGGVISNDGSSASGSTGAQAGLVGTIGGTGSNGTNGQTTSAAGPSAITVSLGGNGGSGGAGTGGAGGVPGGVSAPTATYGTLRGPMAATGGFIYTTSITQPRTGSGGGGGGGNSVSAGGGGGGGGGYVLLVAKSITNGGTIRAAGGNGAAGTASNCGGGGGGGGGLVVSIYNSYSGSDPTAPGGTGGASGGGSGVAGGNGSSGTVIKIPNA